MYRVFPIALASALFAVGSFSIAGAAPRIDLVPVSKAQIHLVAAKAGNGKSGVLVTSLLLAPGGNKGVGGGVGGGRYCNRSGLSDGTNPGLGDNGPGRGQGAVRSGNTGQLNPGGVGAVIGGGGCPASD